MVFDSAAKNLLMLLGSVTNAPLLAIFLDEIEHIVPYQEGDEETLRLYTNLMDSLRGLQQETNNLSLLIQVFTPLRLDATISGATKKIRCTRLSPKGSYYLWILIALTERGIISAPDDSRHYHIHFDLFRDWIRLHKLGME